MLSARAAKAGARRRRCDTVLSDGRLQRAETQRLQGAHLHNSVSYVEPATEEQVGMVATALMRQLAIMQPDPAKRSWFKLFKAYDQNGDGHISYAEVIGIPSHLPSFRVGPALSLG